MLLGCSSTFLGASSVCVCAVHVYACVRTCMCECMCAMGQDSQVCWHGVGVARVSVPCDLW